MPVIIRHGPKQWSNGKGPHDDPPLIENETREILKKTVDKLLKKKQIPSLIISSPYLRTLQTSYILKFYLSQYGINVNIHIDEDLREYIKGQGCRLFTNNQIEYVKEDEKAFNNRIGRIKKKDYWNKNVWLITHRPVIDKLCNGLHLQTGKYVIIN